MPMPPKLILRGKEPEVQNNKDNDDDEIIEVEK